jgi:biopolymer transport protein ExbB
MIENLKNILVSSGASWVLWLLFGLSVASIAVMLERARVFWSQRDDITRLVADLHELLGKGDVAAARERLTKSRSAEAVVVLAGLAQWHRGASAAQEAMAAATGLLRARLEKRLIFLGTVGNNAPFIGLLGTVIGVVGAFDALGSGAITATTTQLASERVMSTISEALVATAVGLLVAIPAVAVFNYFQNLLMQRLTHVETLGHVLLTHLGGVQSQAATAPSAHPAAAVGER